MSYYADDYDVYALLEEIENLRYDLARAHDEIDRLTVIVESYEQDLSEQFTDEAVQALFDTDEEDDEPVRYGALMS